MEFVMKAGVIARMVLQEKVANILLAYQIVR